MAYATLDDIRDLGYIPEEDLDVLDAERPTRIPRLFEAESAIFDAYLRPKYGVPMPGTPVPIELTAAVVAIVVAHLYTVRGFPSISDGDEVVKEILAARDRAFKLRDDIRDGRAQLNWAKDATPDLPEAGASTGYAPSAGSFKQARYSTSDLSLRPRRGGYW